ncbi:MULTISPECIES: acyl-CoA dehydrogenase family protein [Mesorhizobium]|uniref:acyl-CoA dehydrogenase family protein n=1 Tax=Mesorhizobium TaxID=68287 RepID=UPI0010A96DE9|nr:MULTISPECIES: acyl-CoA dehydrogenase family protein [Mesorhizobium]
MQRWSLWPWPFFDPHHREIAKRASAWRSPIRDDVSVSEMPQACREIARSLGAAGLLDLVVPEPGGRIDVRALCIAREAISYHSALADCVIATQGIGTVALWQQGSEAQKARYLAPARQGKAIAAFALTERGSGSDVANLTMRADRDGDSYILNGDKTFISNAPFADHYIVVARTGEGPGAKGLSAFIVDVGTAGFMAGEPIEMIAAHPVGSLTFTDCRIPGANIIGDPGRGFGIAMATFDIFRISVGAAAIGMARRALDETVERVKTRTLFNAAMAEIAGVQTKLADMSCDLDLGALAVYRAAWSKDTAGGRCTREASMAKLAGTEAAGRIIDSAVQIFGGQGVTRGSVVERLQRGARATRIYHGASEVQKIVIGRSLLSESESNTCNGNSKNEAIKSV